MQQLSHFDFQPTLVGELITLRPLKAEDFAMLYAAASDPLVWEQHPDPTRYQREVFQKQFFAGAISSGSAFVVIDNVSGQIVGSSRYYEWNPAEKEVAIGYTFLARSHWGRSRESRNETAHADSRVSLGENRLVSYWSNQLALQKSNGKNRRSLFA